MKNKNNENTPFEKLIFVLIAIALIVLTDLFVLGGMRGVIDNYKNGGYFGSNNIDVATLRAQHNNYMEKGININSNMLASSSIGTPPLPSSNPNMDLAQNYNNNYAPDISINEVTLQEKGLDVANIEPAAGVEGDLKLSFSKNENRPLIDNSPDIIAVEKELAAKKKSNESKLKIDDEIKAESTLLEDIKQESPERESPEQEKHKNVTQVIYDLGVEISDPLGKNQSLNNEIYKYSNPKGKGLIAIIIDDMGVSLRSKQVEALPYPLTFSYLPYAKNLAERTKKAAKNGHDVMLHMPMQAMNNTLDGGPNVLKASQSDKEFIDTLKWNLSSFDNFIGFNNHMGSQLTKDEKSMQKIMDYINNLKETGRELFFIDSKTIGSSIAAKTAHNNGVPYAERDIFIDHKQNAQSINDALTKLENIANDRGYAIAIGHPRKETIAALKKWLPTLERKGLTLVPISKLVKYPIKKHDANDDNGANIDGLTQVID